MKKTFLSVLFVLFSMAMIAQTKKPVATKKTVIPTVSSLKIQSDFFSNVIELIIGNFYKEQGVKNINNAQVLRALNDIKAGKPQLNETQTNNCIVGYMQTMNSEKASGNKKEGIVFLEENKRKDGVIALPSGLQYQIIKEATGPKPTLNDKVKVHYHGTLLDGSVFDSSVQRGEPFEFNLSGVIPGWTEALQLMAVGSKWKLFIPSSLAYGDNQAGPAIKPGSTLIFEVELLEIVK